MTKILAFSGKKQAGKNAAANQLLAIELTTLGIVRGRAIITPKGEIRVTDLFGSEEHAGLLDLNRNNAAMIEFKAQHLDPYVKCYSFADALKQDVCINVLGLSWSQCYGTDKEKNSKTHFRWENMPGVVTDNKPPKEAIQVAGRLGKFYKKLASGVVFHPAGVMTARDIMQYVGTEMFRKMYGNVWVDSTLRRIEIEQPMCALITDCRFPNEVVGVQAAGGKVMRFTRDIYKGQDQHESETALDANKFDPANFNWLIDNHDMNLLEQMEAVYGALVDAGWAEPLQIITQDEEQ